VTFGVCLLLVTSLYEDPAAGLYEDASAGFRDEPDHDSWNLIKY